MNTHFSFHLKNYFEDFIHSLRERESSCMYAISGRGKGKVRENLK